MRIGRYQLRGIRKRFWFLLAALVLLVTLLLVFWPRPASVAEEWNSGNITAFSNIGLSPVAQLRDPSLKVEDIFADKRLGNCQRGNPRCIFSVQEADELVQYWGPNATGVPFRFRAYIPSQEAISEGSDVPLSSERGSLYSEKFSDGGWSFRPAVLLEALDQQSALVAGEGVDPLLFDTGAANALSPADDGTVNVGATLLGFQGGVPASGAIYDFDAILFSTSNAIDRPTDPFYSAQPVPTFLVRDFRRVGSEEVLEPASEVADLDISYAAGSTYQLDLHSFEWPADGKARMCITLSNRSTRPVPIWGGLYEGMRVRIGGVTLLGVPAPGSAFEIGTTIEEMQTGESLSGYVVFGLEQEGSGVSNVSGSPSEQEVRLSVASLLQVDPGTSGSLSSQEIFIELSDGAGGGIPFEPIRRKAEDWATPLVEDEACAE